MDLAVYFHQISYAHPLRARWNQIFNSIIMLSSHPFLKHNQKVQRGVDCNLLIKNRNNSLSAKNNDSLSEK